MQALEITPNSRCCKLQRTLAGYHFQVQDLRAGATTNLAGVTALACDTFNEEISRLETASCRFHTPRGLSLPSAALPLLLA
jgi:hypothetical protein